MRRFLLPIAFCVAASQGWSQDDGTIETFGPSSEELAVLLALPETQSTQAPTILGFSPPQAQASTLQMKAAKKNFVEDVIDPNVKYDIVVQVGHFPRTKGATGSQGDYITEQEGAAYVATKLRPLLQEDGRTFAIIGADAYKQGE